MRVFGWTSDVAELMSAADLMVSKPGHTFDEAIASGLLSSLCRPLLAPSACSTGCSTNGTLAAACGILDELATVLTQLLRDADHLTALRASVAARRAGGAAGSIARWLREAASSGAVSASAPVGASPEALRFAMTGDGRQ